MGDSTDLPWRLLQEITVDQIAVEDAVETLQANGGGDSPESYGRALYEADLDAAVGWRPGARRLVVLVADEMPHDEDLNEGIPEELQSASVQADTGIDPGRDGVVGTSDDLDWQPLLQQLRADGIPLLYVLFNGDPAYLPYWKVWTQITGGSAQDSNEEGLADTIVQLVDEGISSELPPCPVGQERDAQGECTQIRPAPDASEASGAPSGNAQEASASEAELRGVEDTFARASEDDGVPCPIYGFAGRPQGVDEVAADFQSRNRRPALGVQFGRVLQGVPSCGPAAPISTLTGSMSLKLAGASGARIVPSTRLTYLQVAPNRPPGRYDLRFTCGPRTDGVETYAAETDGFTGTVLTAEGYRPISPRSVPRRILLDLACPTREPSAKTPSTTRGGRSCASTRAPAATHPPVIPRRSRGACLPEA